MYELFLQNAISKNSVFPERIWTQSSTVALGLARILPMPNFDEE